MSFAFFVPFWKTASIKWDNKDVKLCHPTAEPETGRREQSVKYTLRMLNWLTCWMRARFSNRLPPLDDCGKDCVMSYNHTGTGWCHSMLGCVVFVRRGGKRPFHIGWHQDSRIIPPQTECTAPQRLKRQQHRLRAESLTFPCGLKTSASLRPSVESGPACQAALPPASKWDKSTPKTTN